MIATTNGVTVMLIEMWFFTVPLNPSRIGLRSLVYDLIIGAAISSILAFEISGTWSILLAIRDCTSSINDVSAASMVSGEECLLWEVEKKLGVVEGLPLGSQSSLSFG